MMLGLLLARAGLKVTVLEKHSDFLRDFRGDTIHPSTLEIIYELGLLERFLELPHQKVPEIAAQIGDDCVKVADFRHLPTRCKFIAFMPQWHFLDFLADQGRVYPGFHLRMDTQATGLISEASGRITGLRAKTDSGEMEIRADLIVAADGRTSLLRETAGLEVEELGAPIDVLWFRISRQSDDPETSMGRFGSGWILVLINRGEYWQCGYVIPKGLSERVRAMGIDAFRADLKRQLPLVGRRVDEIRSWDDVKLLTVRVNRVKRWYRGGFLCIGDAAHAMSPVGGVGINLAIQDAVAAANLLARPLLENRLTDGDLARVQRRRMFPTRITQRMQVLVQERIISRVLESNTKLKTPWPVRMLGMWPLLRRIPARLIGIGVRPEHVRTMPQPVDR